jgi:hypothetical protein
MNDDVHFTAVRLTEFIGGGDLRALVYDATQSLKIVRNGSIHGGNFKWNDSST